MIRAPRQLWETLTLVEFTKLRLDRFPSPSSIRPELLIQPGLTGHCRPQWLRQVEPGRGVALVMGETSAKRARGGEMDDVIFGGTGARPARNVAKSP